MTDTGYVVAGWVIAGGVLGAYTVVLARRLRRAESEQSAEDS